MKDLSQETKRYLFSFIVGGIVLAGSFYLSRVKIDFNQFSSLGYIGVFLATLIGSATLFFPVPNVATVFAAGMLFNPIGIAFTGGLGSTIGELVGYYVGVNGGEVGSNVKGYSKVSGWVKRNGGISIFFLALIPNPFFDIAGIVAGLTKYPLGKFFFATLCGKTVRSLILAYFGSRFT